MATGKAPFGGSSTADVFAALLREEPPAVSKVNPAMPKRLDPIVTRLLAKDPQQRYATEARVAKPYDRLFPGSYVQGLAYLQLHDAGHALSAFQSALQSRANMIVPAPPSYAPAQLGVARSYAMGGDKTKAKQTYQDFFTTWKDADTNLPMLVAAKKEFAAL